jgi:anti-sigma factor RsiW
MNTHECLITEEQPEEVGEVCIDPAVGSLLPDYIVDLLEEREAEEIEEHLAACHYCKENYLAILRIRYAALKAKTSRGAEDESALNEANVLKFADFKKHQQ